MFLEDYRFSRVPLLVGLYSLMNDSFVLYLESLVYLQLFESRNTIILGYTNFGYVVSQILLDGICL
ncbi:hypothetical protein MtrunA17_Chr2g0283161 [Medicago truncatula]|uniref:Uncharacterized protein n=1 Tax=Medicago truncatula TaxID=3880 RepID=A0A396J3V9_MEDTR|nr:hypothetical protein MtrunA17_Chr2g0283161 [Medicago truncatula]